MISVLLLYVGRDGRGSPSLWLPALPRCLSTSGVLFISFIVFRIYLTPHAHAHRKDNLVSFAFVQPERGRSFRLHSFFVRWRTVLAQRIDHHYHAAATACLVPSDLKRGAADIARCAYDAFMYSAKQCRWRTQANIPTNTVT